MVLVYILVTILYTLICITIQSAIEIFLYDGAPLGDYSIVRITLSPFILWIELIILITYSIRNLKKALEEFISDIIDNF